MAKKKQFVAIAGAAVLLSVSVDVFTINGYYYASKCSRFSCQLAKFPILVHISANVKAFYSGESIGF